MVGEELLPLDETQVKKTMIGRRRVQDRGSKFTILVSEEEVDGWCK